MTSTTNGKFCNSCNKEVLDFTTFTNTQIVQHLKALNSDNVCGRFYETQLNTWLQESKLSFINPKLYKYLLSFLMFSVSNQLQAQQNNNPITITKNVDTKSNKNGIKISSNTDSLNCKKTELFEDVKIRMGSVRRLTSNNEPLLIVDGKTKGIEELSKINPKDIKAVDIIKGGKAVSLYGPNAVNGVIIITTKACSDDPQKNIPIL